jgi:hypothetical protein
MNPGQYAILLRATDNVMRRSETQFVLIEVKEKPKPVEPMPEKAPPPKPTKGTLQGIVRFDDAGYSGAKVKLSGPVSGSTTSGNNGFFKFDDLPAGAYTIEATGTPRNKIRSGKAEVTFEPPRLKTPATVELN